MLASYRTRFVSPSAALLSALLTLSCEQVVTTVGADRIDIAPPTSFVKQTETAQLTATVLSRDGSTLVGRTVAWTSLDPGVATVDEAGMVQGVTPGTATIEATSEGVVATATVTVTSGPAIAAAPREVEFLAVLNGATPGDRAINITNAGDGTLSDLAATVTYAAGEPTGWLSANLSGPAPTTLVLSANQGGRALGTYTATVQVTSSVASNSPIAVTVRLTVLAPQPAIALGATTVDFDAAAGAGDPATQDVAVTNAGGGALTGLTATVAYTSNQPSGWLSATLAGTSAPTTLTLRAATGSLEQGKYTATVKITSPIAQNSPQTVTVTFTVGAPLPAISLTPVTLSFAAPKAGANPAAKTAQVANTGAGSLGGLSVSITYPGNQPSGWLTTNLSRTTAPATLTVGAVTGTLDVGAYTATIRVASAQAPNSPQSIDVTFQVQPQPAAISLSRNTVDFSTTRLTGDPAAQQVAITNTGGGTVSGLTRTISYTSGQPTGWLTADLSTTTAPATLTLTARLGSLAVGTYNAKVRIAASSASNSPVEITVTFTIAAAPPAAPGAPIATAASDRRIDLSWADQSDNESYFAVERSTSALVGFDSIGSAGANQTTYGDSIGLAGSTTYYYRVKACNAVGCTPNLTTASATTAPNEPSNLVSTAVGATRVDLTWTDNSSDETGFPVERSSDGGITWVVMTTTAAGITSFSHTNAAAGTTYRYRVRACRSTDCSRYSAESQATTSVLPAAPSALAATTISATQINLTWTDNSTNETQFRIEARTAATPFAQVGTVAANTTSLSHTLLSPKTQYVYKVRACNATDCSAYSSEITAVTSPSAPTGLSATAPSHTQVNLSWTAPAQSVTGYTIERRNGTDAFALLVNVVGGTTTTYSDNDVQPGTAYVYRVKACDSANCSAFSNEATVTTPPTPVTPPGAPGSLAATAVSSSRIDLSWIAASGSVSKYYIERKTTSLGTYAVIDSVASTSSSYQNTDLLAATEYWYRVRACNTSGCSDSNEYAATTLLAPPPAPSPPASAQATAVSASQIELTWAAVSGTVERYRIHRKTGSAGTWAVIDSVAGTVTTLQNAELLPATLYYYRVDACNSGGCSGYSPETSATTAQVPPGAPSGLTATAQSSDRIALAWSASSGTVDWYYIERRNNSLLGNDWAVIDSVAGGTLAYLSTGLTPLTSYSHRVRAWNAAGLSGSSNETTTSTLALPTPNTPATFVATATSATQIRLTWTHDGLLLNTFEIERAPGSAPASFSPLQTVAGSARTYVDSGLTGGTIYYYRSRACSLTGCSGWSNVANAKTLTPAVPTSVSAVAISASQILLSWTPPGGQTSYKIRRRVDGKGQWDNFIVSDGNATSYMDNGRSANTRYTYEICARGADDLCSSWSSTVEATTPR
jgi:fibronectin type 3 domain-containing protein